MPEEEPPREAKCLWSNDGQELQFINKFSQQKMAKIGVFIVYIVKELLYEDQYRMITYRPSDDTTLTKWFFKMISAWAREHFRNNWTWATYKPDPETSVALCPGADSEKHGCKSTPTASSTFTKHSYTSMTDSGGKVGEVSTERLSSRGPQTTDPLVTGRPSLPPEPPSHHLLRRSVKLSCGLLS